MSEIRYRRHNDLRIAELQGEGVVLHLGERRYFSVNETGLAILEATSEPRTFAELVARVMETFEVGSEEAETTIRAFLDQCVSAKVILEEQG